MTGLAEFSIESAGGPSDSLEALKGVPLPKDADDKDITDQYELLGEVFVPHIALTTDPSNLDDVEAATGLIRLEVVAGAGGTGEAAPARVVRSKTGLRNYLDEDGEIEQDRKVHAGDDEIEIVFKYTPVETINDGDLRFTVPEDWSKPDNENPNDHGYIEVNALSGANIQTEEPDNWNVIIPIVQIDSSQSIEIRYGSGSPGAQAPSTRQMGDDASEFTFAVKGTSGRFENIGVVLVEVRSQASGEGSASVDSGAVDELDNATVHAGADGSITITYTSIGQIVNGRVKLTVPEALTGGADGDGVTASDISVSGDAKYGGVEDLDLDANADITKDDVLVSGVNLRTDGTLTFTYTGMMPEATQAISEFAVAVDGGEGPGEVDPDEVDAWYANPCSRSVMRSPVTVDGHRCRSRFWYGFGNGDDGDVVASQYAVGNEITVTYTAIGEIDAEVRQSQLPFPTVGHHLSTIRCSTRRSWEPSPLCTYSSLMTTLLRMLSLKMVDSRRRICNESRRMRLTTTTQSL